MQYADFSKFTIDPEHLEFLEACYQAGVEWANLGHKKLPVMATVGDKKIPVVRSIGDAGHAFVKGWKSVR